MLRTLLLCTALLSAPAIADTPQPASVVQHYAVLVHATYGDALTDALAMQQDIQAFLVNPTETNLAKAKESWLAARAAYGYSESFRFYEGPIDFVDAEKGQEGPEGRLNAWPLNEAYIDYVVGNPTAGIVQDESKAITKGQLSKANQAEDEADVATGYHAIEFLLWGQDLNKDGPGARAASDFAPGDPARDRRRAYLKTVTDLLVDDLKFLLNAWAPKQNNYAHTFITQDTNVSISHMLTALATLSGFELASERMGTALDSGDQEDEHSCFSDNTHNDFIYNSQGIDHVYFGQYGELKGSSLHGLLRAKDITLAAQIEAQLHETRTLIAALPHPIDREILSTPEGSPARAKMEAAISSLQKQAALFVEAGAVLGVPVRIMSE